MKTLVTSAQFELCKLFTKGNILHIEILDPTKYNVVGGFFLDAQSEIIQNCIVSRYDNGDIHIRGTKIVQHYSYGSFVPHWGDSSDIPRLRQNDELLFGSVEDYYGWCGSWFGQLIDKTPEVIISSGWYAYKSEVEAYSVELINVPIIIY